VIQVVSGRVHLVANWRRRRFLGGNGRTPESGRYRTSFAIPMYGGVIFATVDAAGQ